MPVLEFHLFPLITKPPKTTVSKIVVGSFRNRPFLGDIRLFSDVYHLQELFLDGGLKHVSFIPYLGRWSNLTVVFFQLGWNHQPRMNWWFGIPGVPLSKNAFRGSQESKPPGRKKPPTQKSPAWNPALMTWKCWPWSLGLVLGDFWPSTIRWNHHLYSSYPSSLHRWQREYGRRGKRVSRSWGSLRICEDLPELQGSYKWSPDVEGDQTWG